MPINISKKRTFFGSNIVIVLPLILLSALGVITLLSTRILPDGSLGELSIVWKQVIALGIGWLGFLFFSKVDLTYLKYWQVLALIYGVTVALLVITLFFAPVINGVRRWLVIGGFQIQPSEIAKLSVILITASIMSMKEKFNEWILFLITLASTLVIFLLIYLEPGGSMSLLIMSIWFLLAFLGLSNPFRNSVLVTIIGSITTGFLVAAITGNWYWYALVILGIVIAIFSIYSRRMSKILVVISLSVALLLGVLLSVVWDSVLRDYQKDRIEAFFNPAETESNIGFNVNQSRIAIGSGQIFGKGFGNGTQSKREFIPEHETDFIFASYAEEFGLVGSLFLLGLYAAIVLVCFTTGMNLVEDRMLSLICIGVGLQILLGVFINVGTNLGAIPATGIPLPLMSSGGTVTIMTLFSMGIVQNIYMKYLRKTKNKSEDILDVYEIS
ncbi:MAG TPA: FtsW/RodA/SpoVE family cell cycle protein [Candidatus Dojkabacteria bacterium]|nr:FtsW/RodA/SpoVE family cell cycle protein [Candidatus Dojkabacteria bacterium]